jgi:L-threonylcarbamoyladenylate synthase
VVSEFGAQLDVLDGGPCQVGIESTIIDCTRGHPVLLRPGMLDADTLASTAGQAVLSTQRAETELNQASPKASGTLASHYAPSARLKLLTVEAMDQAAQPMSLAERARVGVWSFSPLDSTGLAWRPMPTDPALCAQELFQTLRELEALGVEEIWVTPPPHGVAWDGVRDRLTRASQ